MQKWLEVYPMVVRCPHCKRVYDGLAVIEAVEHVRDEHPEKFKGTVRQAFDEAVMEFLTQTPVPGSYMVTTTKPMPLPMHYRVAAVSARR